MSATGILVLLATASTTALAGADDLAQAGNWNASAEAAMLRGSYDEARRLYSHSLPLLEQALGPENPATITTLANLCDASSHLTANLDAKPLCIRALALREKVLGPNHPEVARSLSDLGILYANEGDLGRAESLLGRALRIENSLPDPQDMPALLNNLGYLYFKKKKYQAAEDLFERAIAETENSRGPGDPDLAPMRANLAKLQAARRAAAAARSARSGFK